MRPVRAGPAAQLIAEAHTLTPGADCITITLTPREAQAGPTPVDSDRAGENGPGPTQGGIASDRDTQPRRDGGIHKRVRLPRKRHRADAIAYR
jgi:hypothetical protein